MGRESEQGRRLRVRCGSAADERRLGANGVLGLHPGACGLTLRCLSGIVVVTQRGDREDHVLRPGEAFVTERRGLVVAWALTGCEIAVGSLLAEDAPRRAA